MWARPRPVSATPVSVVNVHADFNAGNGRVGYKLTLSCGCSFWELRDASAPFPEIDAPALCFADHSTVGGDAHTLA